jgi:hypothetical protein
VSSSINHHDAYEALVQFLYRAPIGLVQIDWAGSVELLNPMASNLLMPLVGSDGLDNLYTVLQAHSTSRPASSAMRCACRSATPRVVPGRRKCCRSASSSSMPRA